MKKFICDYCEQEMYSPWMTIQITGSSTWHFCWKCAERYLAAAREMEEANEEEKEAEE